MTVETILVPDLSLRGCPAGHPVIRIDRAEFDKATAAIKDAAACVAHDDYPTDEHLAHMETCDTRFRAERQALRTTVGRLDKATVDETTANAIAHARDEAKSKAAKVDDDFERMLSVIIAQRRQSAAEDRIKVNCPICRCGRTTENLADHVASHLAGVPSCGCSA